MSAHTTDEPDESGVDAPRLVRRCGDCEKWRARAEDDYGACKVDGFAYAADFPSCEHFKPNANVDARRDKTPNPSDG